MSPTNNLFSLHLSFIKSDLADMGAQKVLRSSFKKKMFLKIEQMKNASDENVCPFSLFSG